MAGFQAWLDMPSLGLTGALHNNFHWWICNRIVIQLCNNEQSKQKAAGYGNKGPASNNSLSTSNGGMNMYESEQPDSHCLKVEIVQPHQSVILLALLPNSASQKKNSKYPGRNNHRPCGETHYSAVHMLQVRPLPSPLHESAWTSHIWNSPLIYMNILFR